MDKLFTPSKSFEGLYKDKGSKFISYLYPVTSEEEVKDHIQELRNSHKKARHFCYAFRIGFEGGFERSSDDGEPSGSAGLPILNQLHSANLSNVCLIIVRYFGGTKLGMGGLIKAYKESAKQVISLSKVISLVSRTNVQLEFPITVLGEVERCIISTGAKVIKSEYGEKCVFVIDIESESLVKLIPVFESINDLIISVH